MEVSIQMSDKTLKDSTNYTTAPKSSRKKFPVFKVILGIILVSVITVGGYVLYKGYKVSSDIGLQLKPSNILKPKDPELKKDSTGKNTSVMIVGIDTRDTGNLMNTDTIIVATYNYETKNITMISIPRDFYVRIYPDKSTFSKINSVYAYNEQRKKGSGMDSLRNVVEELTNIEIQYYGMIDYQGFVQLIDAVGGVDVNVENSFTDYMYPKGVGYQTVSFKAGPQTMDGETALKYSRSRHSMNNNEGTDFARARRQQRVIEALMNTVMSSETLLNPQKIMNLMSAVQNNIRISEFTIDDIKAGINILKDFKNANGTVYSFVLDPSSGSSSLIKSQTDDVAGYIILPIEGIGKYTKIKEYVDLIRQDPHLYSENPMIYVYNTGLGYQPTYEKTQELRNEFKYLNIKYLGNLYTDKEGTYVFSNKENEFTYSTNILSKYIKPTATTKPDYVTTNLKGEDISVFFGKQITTTTQTSSL